MSLVYLFNVWRSLWNLWIELWVALIPQELNFAFMCEFALDLILVKLYLLVVLEKPKVMSKTTSYDQLGADDSWGKVEPRFYVLGPS